MKAQSPHCRHGARRANRAAVADWKKIRLPIDVSHRLGVVAGESRAGVQRPIGTNRVRVLPVELARPHVHAVERGEPVARVSRCRIRHLVVHEMARVADRTARRARSRTTRPAAGVRVFDRRDRDDPVRRVGRAGRMTGLNDTSVMRGANSCSSQEGEQRRIPVRRVERRSCRRRSAAPAAPRGACSRRCDRTCPGRRAGGRMPVVRLLVAVERDLDGAQAERQQAGRRRRASSAGRW